MLYLLHFIYYIFSYLFTTITLENCQCCCDHDSRQIETSEVIGHPMAAISH